MWKLVGRLTEFANNPSSHWPSADHGDYLAENENFVKSHARIVEQVSCNHQSGFYELVEIKLIKFIDIIILNNHVMWFLIVYLPRFVF